MSKDANTVSCTCTPSRGLACRKCYAPHYEAGLHLVGLTGSDDAIARGTAIHEAMERDIALIDPTTVAAQLVEWSERNKDEDGRHG